MTRALQYFTKTRAIDGGGGNQVGYDPGAASEANFWFRRAAGTVWAFILSTIAVDGAKTGGRKHPLMFLFPAVLRVLGCISGVGGSPGGNTNLGMLSDEIVSQTKGFATK